MSVPLESLRCPITRSALCEAPPEVVAAMQRAQWEGTLRNRAGAPVVPFEGGLVNEGGSWFFPIRSGIPVLLADEAIAAGNTGIVTI